MILVDTSVWIRFVAGDPAYAAGLDRLLSRDEVFGHELVYGELLIGDRGGRRQLLADYELLPHAPVVPHRDVVALVREQRLHGRGVGWIDSHLLASVHEQGLTLWTADPRLAALAAELHVAHEA